MVRIMVAAGDPGTGKSRLGMDVEEPIEFWDIENKNKDMQRIYYPNKIIHRKDILAYDNTFHEDWYGTYLNLKKEIDNVVKLGQEVRDKKRKDIGFEWLVIDGISPIRNKCMLAKWFHDNPKRKQPNEFEWGDINDDVRNLLFPLVNMTVAGIIPNLLFTAEFQDSYENLEVYDDRQNKIVKKSVKSGREPAYKDYLGYKLYTLLELYADVTKKKYKVVCTKSIVGIWDSDVTDKSVYDVILEKGL